MNMQQGLLPKSSLNGFDRRRGERDLGTRLESKSGKSNTSRITTIGASTSGGVGVYEGPSPSHDRLAYVTTCLIGQTVDVHLKDGSVYSGIFHAGIIPPSTDDKQFGVILKMARLTKDGTSSWQMAEFSNKPSAISQMAEFSNKPSAISLIIPGKELVQLTAKNVPVSVDAFSYDIQHEKNQEILVDSRISHFRHVELERELEPWVPEYDDQQFPELDDIFDGTWNRGWNQFETNEALFGVKSTFNEELYTTKLERGPQMREREKEASRLAREIEVEETHDIHMAEERGFGFHDDCDIDEETRYSAVYRGGRIDDGGYVEKEDHLLDSCNVETFGRSTSPVTKRKADRVHQKNSDELEVLSSFSLLDEAIFSQSNDGSDFRESSSVAQASQLASKLTSISFSTLEHRSRAEKNAPIAHREGDITKQQIEMPMDAQWSKVKGSQSLVNRKNSGIDSNSSIRSRQHERKSTTVEVSEVAVPGKVDCEPQSTNMRSRPASSASIGSGRIVGAIAPISSGLSPSSSVGSLSSEKSTLNPYAKEFKLNPNAKSYTPSQMSLRPVSPVSDGSFYYAIGASAPPHMPGMPVGVGIGASFSGHQHVIYNPQVSPVQSQHAYFSPSGHHFGQQMLVGQPRQFYYVPGYQQEMPYNGREF